LKRPVTGKNDDIGIIVIFDISFTSQQIGNATIYWGGSLAEKMISCVYFVVQSAYFRYFRSRQPTIPVFAKS